MHLLALGFCFFLLPFKSRALLQQVETKNGIVFVDADPLLQYSDNGPINLKTFASIILKGKPSKRLQNFTEQTLPTDSAMRLYAAQLSGPRDQKSKIIAMRQGKTPNTLIVTFLENSIQHPLATRLQGSERIDPALDQWVQGHAELIKRFLQELALRIDAKTFEQSHLNINSYQAKPQSEIGNYLATINEIENSINGDNSSLRSHIPEWLSSFLIELGYVPPNNIWDTIGILKDNAYHSENFAVILAMLQLAQKDSDQSIRVIREILTKYSDSFLPKLEADSKQKFFEFVRDGKHENEQNFLRTEAIEAQQAVVNNKGETFQIKRSRVTILRKSNVTSDANVFFVSRIYDTSGHEVFSDGPRRVVANESVPESYQLGSSLLGTYVPPEQQNTGLYTKVLEMYSGPDLKISKMGLESENRETLQLYSTFELLVRSEHFRESIKSLPNVKAYLEKKGITETALDSGNTKALHELANLLSGLTLQARARSKVSLNFYPGRGYLGQFYSSFVSKDDIESTQRALKEVDVALASAEPTHPLHPFKLALPKTYRAFLERAKK